MTIQFINGAGEAIKDIAEMLPVINAGSRPVKTKLFFRNDYDDVVALSFALESNDPRVKILAYTEKLNPSAIGWIEIESEADLKVKRAIPLQLSCEATLVGPPPKVR